MIFLIETFSFSLEFLLIIIDEYIACEINAYTKCLINSNTNDNSLN